MFKKKKLATLLLLLLTNIILPLNVFAYSDYVIAGGQNIGIELDSNGVIIVGTYEVNKESPAKNANLKTGDKIIKINETPVSSIKEMINAIDDTRNDTVTISYLRANKEYQTELTLIQDNDNVYKTGLYVKDSISGVGTLTFIDPSPKYNGALGHEIIEKTTGQKLEIKDGKIYSSTVTSINPSIEGNPGEKNAIYNSNDIFGNITENSTSGIFGTYKTTIPQNKLYKVAQPSEIKPGEASILTVTKGEEIKEYKINILKINKDTKSTKNMLFEVTDNELLKISGGIVQGMSGSPIIQGDNIIGAVTHVVVDDCTKGYGIFITNMLEEAEN